ncbi:hypothetical protein ACHHYP_01343 [Achlya hypogyna]|uniref:BZIP domain-containing protein n=1 Tax=Achlya hypogyna TaxID=1202772 RepID=A0A1V9ZTI3_ACHHY|nr:hypothetical protein ACHHYP_01343 [Achlya hypogyna]
MTTPSTPGRGPEWSFFGPPMYPDSPGAPPSLKRPKMIPLVDCAFCRDRVPARSNSLRRHLRECSSVSDEARQFCVKQQTPVTTQSLDGPKVPLERSFKATQRRLKNRLACRENRKKKKELRESLKGEVAALCANNATLHGEINALLGFDEPAAALEVAPIPEKVEGPAGDAAELRHKAANFFARYKPGGAVPRHDTPEGCFYSAQTCSVVGDPSSFSAQLTTPGSLEAIWDMKSLLITDISVVEPELPLELPSGDMQVLLVERGHIRHVRLLQRLFNAPTVARIEAAGGGADVLGEFTWRIVCRCDTARAVGMRLFLHRYRSLGRQ